MWCRFIVLSLLARLREGGDDANPKCSYWADSSPDDHSNVYVPGVVHSSRQECAKTTFVTDFVYRVRVQNLAPEELAMHARAPACPLGERLEESGTRGSIRRGRVFVGTAGDISHIA